MRNTICSCISHLHLQLYLYLRLVFEFPIWYFLFEVVFGLSLSRQLQCNLIQNQKLFNNHGGQHQIPQLTLWGTWPIITSPGFQWSSQLSSKCFVFIQIDWKLLIDCLGNSEHVRNRRARGRISCSRSWNISSLKDKNPEKTNSRILD